MKVTIEATIKGLITDLAGMFIFYPDDLEVATKRFGRIISVSWRANRADTSRLIGSGGETFRSLAALVELAGSNSGYSVELERLGQPVVGKVERYARFVADPDWPRERIMKLAERAARAGTAKGQAEVSSGDMGEDRTAIMIQIARSEALHTETVLKQSLDHIFRVIGNANGRVLRVDVTRVLEPEPVQPETSGGRFAPVVDR